MSYEATFTWPYPAAATVIVTGTFDNWSCSFPLKKTNNGFSTTIQLPYGKKVLYKFVVDGQWLTGNDAPTEWDGRGNLNNWIITPVAPVAAPVTVPEPAPVAVSVESEPEATKPEPQPESVPEVPASPAVIESFNDEVKSAISTAPTPTMGVPKASEEPITEAEVPAPTTTEPEVITPVRNVPVIEVTKPEEIPSAEETGTGLGADAAFARGVLESLQAEEEKVAVSHPIGVPPVEEPKTEEPPVTSEPISVPTPAPELAAPSPVPASKSEHTPLDTPVVAPVVEETPAPSTPPTKAPVIVDLSPPTKIVPDTPPAAPPTSSAFSTTTSSTTHTPEKPKSFPLKGSPPSSPSKSLKKEETRKKRTSLIKRIKHVFSSKD